LDEDLCLSWILTAGINLPYFQKVIPFFADMVLVAMDVAAGFIISEKISAHRDTDTWEEHVRSGVKGLNVELVQVVGDGAKAVSLR
jgi:hypothetical protein